MVVNQFLYGKSEYSTIAKVKINIDKLNVSVLPNPFINNITIDFLSNSASAVIVRLTDLSGKTLALQNRQIAKGASRKMMENVAALQKGMYILTTI